MENLKKLKNEFQTLLGEAHIWYGIIESELKHIWYVFSIRKKISKPKKNWEKMK